MHSQFKDQVFQIAGTSYLVLKRDPESPDWFWVKAIKPDRAMLRMHRDDIAGSLQSPPTRLTDRR